MKVVSIKASASGTTSLCTNMPVNTYLYMTIHAHSVSVGINRSHTLLAYIRL